MALAIRDSRVSGRRTSVRCLGGRFHNALSNQAWAKRRYWPGRPTRLCGEHGWQRSVLDGGFRDHAAGNKGVNSVTSQRTVHQSLA